MSTVVWSGARLWHSEVGPLLKAHSHLTLSQQFIEWVAAGGSSRVEASEALEA